MTKITQLKSAVEAEKAALVLDTARKATKAERELNDYIAHEVRNPISSAMTACSFVKTEVMKQEPLATDASRQTTEQDVVIIDNSLKFVNDLLRTMLDIHRSADKQLSLTMVPNDMLRDVLEPVEGMLAQKESRVAMSVDCPPVLFAGTDCLRLKQVMPNLGRNSSKFVEQGFIRLRGAMDGNVQLSVEDSGPGSPLDKQQRLFLKFQESLDVLSQGTVGTFH
jgi:signal transduction histidine kinase